jgi:hypothetical protein
MKKDQETQAETCETKDLSFFDPDCAILHVNGEFDSIGEILKVNLGAVSVFDYTANELENNMNVT